MADRNTLFCDYFDEWVDIYKRGAVRDVTLKKYLLVSKLLEANPRTSRGFSMKSSAGSALGFIPLISEVRDECCARVPNDAGARFEGVRH